MGVDELALRRMLGEVAQKGPRFWHRPAFDTSGMAGEIERQAASDRVAPNQALAHWRPFFALGIAEVVKAQDGAREDLAVRADEVVDLALCRFVQRVVGRTHVGELGIAPASWNLARRQQRIFRRHLLERTVRVPELIAKPEQTTTVVARQQLAVLVEIGYVVDLHAHAAILRRCNVASRLLERPKLATERNLLLVVESLAPEHQHAEAVDARMDTGHFMVRQSTGQIDAGDEAGKQVLVCCIDRLNMNWHGHHQFSAIAKGLATCRALIGSRHSAPMRSRHPNDRPLAARAGAAVDRGFSRLRARCGLA